MAIKGALNQRQKVRLSLLAAGLVVNGLLLFFAKRQWQIVNQKKVEIEQQINRLAIMKRLDEEKLAITDRFEELIAFFPAEEEEVAEVAQKLETIAENSGVELRLNFEDFPEEIDIGGRYQRGLGVNTEIRGSYQGVVSWVQEIQQLPYFIRFSEVKIGILEEAPGVRAELKGIIFLQNVTSSAKSE